MSVAENKLCCHSTFCSINTVIPALGVRFLVTVSSCMSTKNHFYAPPCRPLSGASKKPRRKRRGLMGHLFEGGFPRPWCAVTRSIVGSRRLQPAARAMLPQAEACGYKKRDRVLATAAAAATLPTAAMRDVVGTGRFARGSSAALRSRCGHGRGGDGGWRGNRGWGADGRTGRSAAALGVLGAAPGLALAGQKADQHRRGHKYGYQHDSFHGTSP
jgi:hypothetical protein